MITAFVAYTTLCGGMLASLPPAEKLEVTGTVSAGSGMSVAGSSGDALVNRSPVFMLAEVGVTHPLLPWVEFSGAAQLEMEGRFSFGLVPKVRLMLPPRRLRAYGVVGVPVVLVPFKLLGVQLGVGVELRLHDRFGIMAEGLASAYVLGDDLMTDSALGKFDLVGGLRVHF